MPLNREPRLLRDIVRWLRPGGHADAATYRSWIRQAGLEITGQQFVPEGERAMTKIRTRDEAAIKDVLESLYKAWDAGDADAFVADYTEDATAIMPGTYRTSREEVRQGMAEGFASFLKGSTTINKLEGIRFLGENAALVVTETGVRFPGETEVPAERMVYATWALEKRDGSWLIAAYHNSPAVLPS